MAIRMMVSEADWTADPANVEVVTNYPGGPGTLYMKTSHVGLVLSTGEVNGYDDSDFFATVWNPATGTTGRVTYASTRGWTYHNSATVDATPEVVAAYNAWKAASDAALRAERAARMAAVPDVGKFVKVVSGRKVPVGTEGRVFWFGPDKFARDYGYGFALDTRSSVELGKFRVGIETAKGKVFTNAKNVAVAA